MWASDNTSGSGVSELASEPGPVGRAGSSDDAVAELGMYPFASVRWAWDALWDAVHDLAPWTPRHLAHSGDVHARWSDDRCIVNHVCGWPLAALHSDRHRVLGAFALTIPEADGHHYRSTFVSRHDASLADLVRPDVRVVANSADSLSGWVSFLNGTVGPTGAWPGEVRFTSAHHQSLCAVSRGEADLTCIDSLSLALIEREGPELLVGLHRVGSGPLIPTPAITVAPSVPEADAVALAVALERAIRSADAAAVREALCMHDFVRLTLDDYLPTLALATVSL